jgi:hypothetical protein
MLEFVINAKQAVVIIWTLISIVLALAIVLTLGFPFVMNSWQMLLGLFFGLLLVMTLPIYLLVALLQFLSKETS